MNSRSAAAGSAMAIATLTLVQPLTAQARDVITIVGSSTVYPFSTVVAETFGKKTDFKTPKVEATGSGGGMKLFCNGTGVQHPDITNASRRIKKSEFQMCQDNGVTDIIELKVGYDGIVIANSNDSEALSLSLADIFLALAAEVPDPAGGDKLVENPYRQWNEVNENLPAIEIEVLGPPPTSGTRDAFAELALEGGCQTFDFIEAMKKADKDMYRKVCHTVREDGAYIEAGENDNLIVQKLEANPNAVGVFGYSFLEQNSDKVQGASIDGVEPTFDAIADAEYPVSRPLYVYVKTAHIGVIPGIAEYLEEFTSEESWGEDGYLSEKGMIPMPEEERTSFFDAVADRQSLVME